MMRTGPPFSKLFLTLALLTIFAGRLSAQEGKRASATAKQASTSEGRQVFDSICASCHGLDARGAERGPDIAARPEVVRLSDEDLLKTLRNGLPGMGMPSFAALGDAKLSAVLAYLRTLQGKGATAAAAGDITLGRQLFWGKGQCSGCHMASGAGGFLGPDLSNFGANHSAAEIRAAIISPEKRASPRHESAEVTTNEGKSYSGVVRNEDNFSLQMQSLDGTFHLFSKSELASLKRNSDSLMPADYGSKLTAAEIDSLVAYLAKLANAKQKSGQKTERKPDDESEE